MFSMIDDTTLVVILIIFSLLLGYFSTSGKKTQIIRLVDIIIISPLMIYLGYIGYIEYHQFVYLLLIFFGSTTFTYNLKNYINA